MEKQNTDKLTDKAFSRLIATSVLSLLLCVVCLCSTTWAWFNDGVSSSNNVIKSAKCDLTVTVDENTVTKNTVNVGGSVTLRAGDTGTTTYKVTIEIKEGSASGYCVIKVGNESYYTASVTDTDTERAISFTLVVPANTIVTITPKWGVYSGEPRVKNDDTLTIGTPTSDQ